MQWVPLLPSTRTNGPMKRIGWTGCAALVLAAACGGDGGRASEVASADSQGVPAVTATPAETEAPVPATMSQSGASAPQVAGGEAPPTAADSAAGAREDVSPEWKARERTMASYERCMEQARGADDAMRKRLEAACGLRSGAP